MGRTEMKKGKSGSETVAEIFGENVFSVKTMRRYLSKSAYESLVSTIRLGKTLNPAIANEVAEAMKTWALERGASHYTHWFQPLTGATAEKHNSFLAPDSEGGALFKFSGKELIKGESDASSLPSGGLRATFEARGYTAWDPTSPAFIKQGKGGATLCIPTVFCSYHGDALDKKTPLLRSIRALNAQVFRLAKLFGISSRRSRTFVTLGAEQEYFLVDKSHHLRRLDLVQTGRTLFGSKPAKHQQLEDHYFGIIKSRVLAFMNELDRELWRLGVPAKTRHNEVCPGQFELAPVFEDLNLAVDHNMLVMEILREVADKHGFACLLHEKPFAGMNGSGKHNNWSIHGPDGKNWLSPGDTPRDNARFLVIICALIKAVDTYADLLRAAIASAGNDRRLGSNEAPPPIMSVFLGEQLSMLVKQLEYGSSTNTGSNGRDPGTLMIGISSLPSLPRDMTDRNRTSPFAFTGNKFECRAVGSSQSCAGANIVLNTIVADALDYISTRLEADTASGKRFNDALQKILGDIVKKHKRILFDGDSYSKKWAEEAGKRGLPNPANTPEALKSLTSRKTERLFEKYEVLSGRELRSRYDIYLRTYDQTIGIEADCAVAMARTMVVPAAISYQRELAETISALKAIGATDTSETRKLLVEICRETGKILKGTRALETHIAKGSSSGMIDGMDALRRSVDKLETLLPDNSWPLPSYAELMFMV